MAEIKELKNIEDFNEFVGNPSGLNVLKIGADFCMPCKMLEEELRSLNLDEVTGVRLAKVDADEEWFEDTADELGIRGIPVMIAYKDGKETERVVGMQQKNAIIEFFTRNK